MNLAVPSVRASAVSTGVGLVLLLACLIFGWTAPRESLLSYLFAFVFFTGLAAGSLALLLTHVLTGGAWGEALHAPLWAAARTLPLQALLALPLLLGMRVLYPWMAPALLAHDALLRAQGWYLNAVFFVTRTVVCFLLWLVVLVLFGRWAVNAERAGALPGLSAVGLIIYALTTLITSTDWIMSLLPHWHSSIFGMMVATGWMLGAAALAILRTVGSALPGRRPAPELLRDFGSLLLMFVLAWGYLAFMQYLTVWVADQPAETAWYIPRTLTTWRWLAWFLIVCGFAVPFAVLLSRPAKQHRGWLGAIAGMLLVSLLADALWLVVPDVRTGGFSLRGSDLLAPAGMGALWLSRYWSGLRLEPRVTPARMRTSFGGARD